MRAAFFAGQHPSQRFSVDSDFPHRIGPFHQVALREPEPLPIGRPEQRMGRQFESRHFPRIVPLRIGDKNCLAADERDHLACWRPYCLFRHHVANASRRPALHWPEPQGRLFTLVHKLANQKLRMVRR